MSGTPFHAGELRAQLLAGGAAAGGGIRDVLTEQHRAFFAALPFVLLGATDAAGWPAATVLHGAPGFIGSPDPRHLAITAMPDADDPMASLLQPGRGVGLLGLDFVTRRRNRANGVIDAASAGGLCVVVRESFGNCPRHIHRRTVQPGPRRATATETLVTLDDAARQSLAAADTAFVASSGGELGGADISHRGGPPGFIAAEGDVLSIPDYRGNRYYNTLGNLLVDSRAALLLIDFAEGDTLVLRGRTEIEWRAPDPAAFPEAERIWRLHVEGGWRRRNAIALCWHGMDGQP